MLIGYLLVCATAAALGVLGVNRRDPILIAAGAFLGGVVFGMCVVVIAAGGSWSEVLS